METTSISFNRPIITLSSIFFLGLVFFAGRKRLLKYSLNKNQISIPKSLLVRKIETTFNDSKINRNLCGIYPVTNEGNKRQIHTFLKKEHSSSDENSCHIGFSGLHNFDIIVSGRSSLAIIIDYNPENKTMINTALKIIITNSRKEDAAQQLHNFASKIRCPNYVDNEFIEELDRHGSWLATDESYNHIRTIALEGKIALITQDIRNTTVFFDIFKLIKENGFYVKTLYLSNILYYMKTSNDKQSFQETVKALTEDETYTITASLTKNRELKQNVQKGIIR